MALVRRRLTTRRMKSRFWIDCSVRYLECDCEVVIDIGGHLRGQDGMCRSTSCSAYVLVHFNRQSGSQPSHSPSDVKDAHNEPLNL